MEAIPVMNRTLFVTTELHPETSGGAGVLVDALATRLSAIRPVAILLATPEPVDPTVRELEVQQARIPPSGFLERSEAVAKALAAHARPGDRVEIQDFEGLGYLTLMNRQDLGLERTLLSVRFHGPYDLLSEAMDTVPDDWDLPSAMEREAFLMADLVLVPAAGHIPVLTERYGVEASRIRVAPPLVAPLAKPERRRGPKPVFAVIGRLGEMKGSQDMVAAALSLLEAGIDLEVRFIGGDGWSPASNGWMRERLEAMIPGEFAESFVFTGALARERLPEALADTTAVIAPGRFESFCLAAHEARIMGLALAVPDLPAYRGLLDEHTGALVYDPSVRGLAQAMRRLALEPGFVESLASAPVPDLGDAIDAYRSDPEPHHPRSQAGLATAATQRLELFWQAKKSASKPGVLQRAYRKLPANWVRLLRRLPGPIKDLAKGQASWPEEVTRRHNEAMARQVQERLSAVQRRIQTGAFPDVDDPDVTFVVPVYNDARYLDETLASIYEQSLGSWEVIVVDDGSTDPATVEFLDGLERPRVKVIRLEANQGLPAARNAGMQQARGRYLVPLDSDDEVEPDFIAEMQSALERHPQAAYAHCYARLYQDVNAVWVTRPFNPYWQLLGNGIVGCVLLRREAWEQVGGYDESMTLGNEDWELWIRLMKARWGQVQVARVLFKYRKHGISMSVDTEARFEEGRRMVRDRHPELYEPDRLRRLKSRWYPKVTAIADGTERLHAEIEMVEDEAALAATWGKYVADVRGIEPVPVDLMLKMADVLESEPTAVKAVSNGLPPLVLERRWCLHDPGAPHDGVVVLEDEFQGPEVTLPDHVPRPGWAVPEALIDREVPVQRHPPEEAGDMPDPGRW